MIISKYIIITKTGSCTLRDREPKLNGSEIAVRIKLEIPTALFTRPVLEARMKIPDEAVPRTKITPSIVDNVQKLIKEATSLNMAITIVEQKEEKKK